MSPLCYDSLKFRLYRSLLFPYGAAKWANQSERPFSRTWIETYSSKRIGLTFSTHSWIHQRLTCNKEGTRRPSLRKCFSEYPFVAYKQLPRYISSQLHNAEANISTVWLVCQKDQSPCWWDAPLFAGLAFRPTKNGGWKESALCFLGHRHLLLSVIILSLCLRALMATMMLLPIFLAAALKLRPGLCAVFSCHIRFRPSTRAVSPLFLYAICQLRLVY